MKIFLSGPITGVKDYAEGFKYVENILKENGFKVMNPAVLPPEGFDHEDYMAITLAMQGVCDATFLLPHWEDSLGCCMEVQNANAIQQPIFKNLDTLLRFRERVYEKR